MEERDTQLSQAYREATHPGPAPALDARILDAARQAVAKPAARSRPFWFGWAVPFSSLAVLVLGITLLFRIQHEAPEVLESPTAHPPAQLDQAASAAAPAETATAPSAAEPASPPPAKRAQPTAKETVTAPEHAAPAGNAASSAEAASGVPAPQPFPAQSGTLHAMPPPPPPAAKTEARSAPAPARDAAGIADRSADMAAKPAVPAAAAPARMGAPALGRSLEKRQAEPVLETPEQMVETIRRLMRDGRVEEARQALDKLRRTYPGFVVPEDLQAIPIR
jgi:hypothetical protein